MANIVVFILCAQVYSGISVQNEILQSSDDGKIWFPTENSEQNKFEVIPIRRFEPTEPEECVGQSYCHVKCEKYPQMEMDEFINRYNLKNYSIIEDVSEDEPQLIEGRIGIGKVVNAEKVNNMCQEKIVKQPIFQAKNLDGVNKYIVQGKTFQQVLVTRHCEPSLGSCSSVAKFPSNVEAKCTQVMAGRTLLALSHDGTFETNPFPIPSCCICKWHDKEEHETDQENNG